MCPPRHACGGTCQELEPSRLVDDLALEISRMRIIRLGLSPYHLAKELHGFICVGNVNVLSGSDTGCISMFVRVGWGGVLGGGWGGRERGQGGPDRQRASARQ